MQEKQPKKEILDASVRGKRPYAPSRQGSHGPQQTRTQAAMYPSKGGERKKEAPHPDPAPLAPAAAPQSSPRRRGRQPKNSPPPVPGAAGTALSSAAESPSPAPAAKQSAAKRSRPHKQQQDPVRLTFLGGLNEVGKNITMYEYRGERILVDCGLAFPDQEMPGVDLVIPDFTYLESTRESILGIVITHGHEDHIGALPYLLKQMNIPIYSAKLTLGLIKGKLREHRLLEKAKLIEIKPGDTISLGGFQVEAIHVNHSIPDALALAITCGAGTIFQTGDFKIDTTPIDGGIIDIARIAQIGQRGVLAMLSDSTNAERPGYTESERKVGESFENLFRKAGNRRILVATFSSNVHRVQQIIDVAEQLGRKVALLGRSLENVFAVGTELGYLKVPEGLVVPIDLIQNYLPEQMVIITTGSQGEPMSALTRMAFSDHRKVEIGPQDCVIISATPIPGNEKTVGRVINELLKLGAAVVYEKMYDVHVSGHACQEELKLMLGLVQPKYFLPVHGEQKHLTKHAGLAQSMGMDPDNILIADNGIQVELSPDEMKVGDPVPAGPVFVDGYGVGDVGNAVLRDRKHLAQDGIIIVAVAVDRETGQMISGPDVVSRGFVYVKESEGLIQEARNLAASVVQDSAGRNRRDWNALRGKLRDEISRLMYERTKRSPIVLPILME
ncbi:MAG: ribonuclease J [Oscillospiraceae bacterium]|jgi:ribonuclease J|nr:ribonuclease J [Oscillospiraceae bacterium]